VLEAPKLAVDARDRVRWDLEVKVRALVADDVGERLVQIEHLQRVIGATCRWL
jgi:hypothetical protein